MLKRLTWPFSWHVGYASSFFFAGEEGGVGVNLICLRVFKVASRMAQGETFSLVVLVLASIYNSLNEIALILRSLGLMHLFSYSLFIQMVR